MRPENNTTASGQGWLSFVLRNLEDADSLLAIKQTRPPDVMVRDSIQLDEIKELWFHGFIPDKNAVVVHVVMVFKTALSQAIRSGPDYICAGSGTPARMRTVDEFMDGTVKHYREV